jgi:hypothetical protein
METAIIHSKDWAWDVNYPVRSLYDDGEYSLIWGKFKDTTCLAGRWNFGQENTDAWHIFPDFIAHSIVQRLFTNSLDSNNFGHLENIQFVIQELTVKLTTFDI